MAAMGKVCAQVFLLMTVVAVNSATEPERNFKEVQTLMRVVTMLVWASGGVVIIIVVAAVCIVRRRGGNSGGNPLQAQTSDCVGLNLSPVDPEAPKDTGSSLDLPYDHLRYHGDAETKRTSGKNIYDHLPQQVWRENSTS